MGLHLRPLQEKRGPRSEGRRQQDAGWLYMQQECEFNRKWKKLVLPLASKATLKTFCVFQLSVSTLKNAFFLFSAIFFCFLFDPHMHRCEMTVKGSLTSNIYKLHFVSPPKQQHMAPTEVAREAR